MILFFKTPPPKNQPVACNAFILTFNIETEVFAQTDVGGNAKRRQQPMTQWTITLFFTAVLVSTTLHGQEPLQTFNFSITNDKGVFINVKGQFSCIYSATDISEIRTVQDSIQFYGYDGQKHDYFYTAVMDYGIVKRLTILIFYKKDSMQITFSPKYPPMVQQGLWFLQPKFIFLPNTNLLWDGNQGFTQQSITDSSQKQTAVQPQTVSQAKDSLKKTIDDYIFLSKTNKETVGNLTKFKSTGEFCLSKYGNELYSICTLDSGNIIDWLVIVQYDSLQLDSLYKIKIANADNYFINKNYDRAKNLYLCALSLKPCDEYAQKKNKMIPTDITPYDSSYTPCNESDKKLSNDERDVQYKNLIARGDKALKENDSLASFVQYWQASKLKPKENYPRLQMLKCDRKIIDEKIFTSH